MKTQPHHTPTPWVADDNIIKASFFDESWNKQIPASKSVEKIGVMNACEDAAFIVRAVNSHQTLIAELNGAKAALESMLDNTEQDQDAFGGSRHSIIKMLHDDISRIKLTIAKAEGK